MACTAGLLCCVSLIINKVVVWGARLLFLPSFVGCLVLLALYAKSTRVTVVSLCVQHSRTSFLGRTSSLAAVLSPGLVMSDRNGYAVFGMTGMWWAVLHSSAAVKAVRFQSWPSSAARCLAPSKPLTDKFLARKCTGLDWRTYIRFPMVSVASRSRRSHLPNPG